MITIRRATDADTAVLLDLAELFITDPGAGYMRLFAYQRHRLERVIALVLEHGIALIADDLRGRPIGMVAAIPLPVLYSDETCLEEIAWYVAPNARGTQLAGPRLLAELQDWACSQSIHMIKLVAPAGSKAGAHYARLGYSEVETTWCKRLTPL